MIFHIIMLATEKEILQFSKLENRTFLSLHRDTPAIEAALSDRIGFKMQLERWSIPEKIEQGLTLEFGGHVPCLPKNININ